MKAMVTGILVGLLITFGISDGFAQKVVAQKESHTKVVAAKKQHHRRARVAVYHPRWAPKVTFAHRWIFFPRHNFYWDNVRAVYVYKVNTVWVTSADGPPSMAKVDLASEKRVELTDMDESDSVQVNNNEH